MKSLVVLHTYSFVVAADVDVKIIWQRVPNGRQPVMIARYTKHQLQQQPHPHHILIFILILFVVIIVVDDDKKNKNERSNVDIERRNRIIR